MVKLVVAYLVSERLPVVGVVAWFASGSRGWAERWLGVWLLAQPSNVCLWLGLLLGLPRGTVAELSGGRGWDHLHGHQTCACGCGRGLV